MTLDPTLERILSKIHCHTSSLDLNIEMIMILHTANEQRHN